MIKKFSLFLMTVLVLAFASGCKKKNECEAGSGGSLTVLANMIHHTRPIKGCRVYVKFNTSEFPGESPSNYDLSFKADDSTSIAKLTGLNCGDYYLYATGIDSLLDPSNNIVKGGSPFSTSQKEGTQSWNIYITEGD
jgi:hypothetical protein